MLNVSHEAHAAAKHNGISEITLADIEQVNGAGIDWVSVGSFAGRAAGIGVRAGAVGLAGAAVSTAIFIAVEALY